MTITRKSIYNLNAFKPSEDYEGIVSGSNADDSGFYAVDDSEYAIFTSGGIWCEISE